MCGIVGYIGKNNAKKVLINGLKRLEYRGYDSAGICVIDKNDLSYFRSVGKVNQLEKLISKKNISGNTGVAHTRWATHGKPSKINAHPQTCCKNEVFVVHNGIIENYKELKEKLKLKGHVFKSDTDTEVIAHLIEENYSGDIKKAVIRSLRQITGAYGLAIVHKKEPNKIIAARFGSPLLIGIGENEKMIASDASAIIGMTKKVIYLDDGEVAELNGEKVKISDIYEKPVNKKVDTISWDKDEITKSGYKYFMAKEIHEAKEVITNSIRGRCRINQGLVKLGGLESVQEKLKHIKRLIIVACGTARYAGLIGEYMLEENAQIPVEVEFASEFRYRLPIISKDTAVLAISQSGETADTLAAVKEAKKLGALTLGIVNVVGSTIARETDAGVYNHIGPEIAVASTKAMLSQITILALLTVFLGRQRKMTKAKAKEILLGIEKLPKQFEEIFKKEENIKKIAVKYKKYPNFMYLGRKYNYPVSLEGALKLKEISYLHAESYPTGEMKHGPIAMISEKFPSIVICPEDSVYEKNISGIEEIKARSGKIIAIASSGDKKISNLCNELIYIPKNIEMLQPILAIVPLQLLAYYVGVELGYNVDRPRNLAKSVTVE